jgi:hypothetical protein
LERISGARRGRAWNNQPLVQTRPATERRDIIVEHHAVPPWIQALPDRLARRSVD